MIGMCQTPGALNFEGIDRIDFEDVNTGIPQALEEGGGSPILPKAS